jgi:hypothetical protein
MSAYTFRFECACVRVYARVCVCVCVRVPELAHALVDPEEGQKKEDISQDDPDVRKLHRARKTGRCGVDAEPALYVFVCVCVCVCTSECMCV